MAAKRILLVEDETGISDFLTIALRGEGYEVDVAATAAEAWACLDAHCYALVITDWRLPDGDGMVIADAAVQARRENPADERLSVPHAGRPGGCP
jgi:DNA-binding response OmpR family regulator